MGCIIEKELPDITAQPNIEEISVLGRSGSLLEWYGDYKSYDLPVGTVTIPYENLEEVKRWLSGGGKLITHNDIDKVIDAIKKRNERGSKFTILAVAEGAMSKEVAKMSKKEYKKYMENTHIQAYLMKLLMRFRRKPEWKFA